MSELKPLDVFLDCFAGAISISQRTKLWALNLPRIAAVGEQVGITESDLNDGGKYHAEIARRVAALELSTYSGNDRERYANEAALDLFGPTGELAPDFLMRSN